MPPSPPLSATTTTNSKKKKKRYKKNLIYSKDEMYAAFCSICTLFDVDDRRERDSVYERRETENVESIESSSILIMDDDDDDDDWTTPCDDLQLQPHRSR